jgi:hypothetical protein
MLVQAYSNGLCRIFSGRNNEAICEFTIKPALKTEVDKRLKILHIKRRETWRDYPEESFSEAKLRFIN